MSRLLRHPVELWVKKDSKGEPVAFSYNGKLENVRRIWKRWRVSADWWREEVIREYFQIETNSSVICDIYHDLLRKRWFLQRIYD